MPACLRNMYMRHHTCIDYLVSRLRNTWLAGRPLSPPPLNYFPTPALWFMMEMKPWGLVDHIFPIFPLALTFCKVSGFYYFSFFSSRCVILTGEILIIELLLLLLRDALNDIFDMCDLTGNKLWSREEFRLYNLLTSDQELDDAEWQVVEGLAVFCCRLN